jgi:hypothetical protein
MKRLVALGKESCPGDALLPLLAPVQKIRLRALCGLPVLNPIGKQPLTTYPLVRSLAALASLSLFSPPWTSAATRPDPPSKPNFSGTRTLDLSASTSLNTRTVWSADAKQLVATHQIKTKQGKEGQLIVTRYLIDDGDTLMVAFTLRLNAEPDEVFARQIWHKQA